MPVPVAVGLFVRQAQQPDIAPSPGTQISLSAQTGCGRQLPHFLARQLGRIVGHGMQLSLQNGVPVGAQVCVGVLVGEGVTQLGHSRPGAESTKKGGHVRAGQGVGVSVGVGVTVTQNGHLSAGVASTCSTGQAVGIAQTVGVGDSVGPAVELLVGDAVGVSGAGGVGVIVAHATPQPPVHGEFGQTRTPPPPVGQGGGVQTGAIGVGVTQTGQPPPQGRTSRTSLSEQIGAVQTGVGVAQTNPQACGHGSGQLLQ